MKWALFVMAILFSCGLGWWLLRPADGRGKNRRRICAALGRLLKRPYGAYVIIEEPGFGKYVQFSGSFDEPLTFDLQRQNLTLDEFERACQLFQKLGYPEPETFEIFTPGSQQVATQTSFIVPFGDDIERGTELCLQVFSHVYAIDPEVHLKLTEA